MKSNNKGAALIWAICASAIVLIILGSTLTLAESYHARTIRQTNSKQAYYTARSAVDTVLSIICDEQVYPTMPQLLNSDFIPDPESEEIVTINSMFSGMDMGDCYVDIAWMVNELNQKDILKITAYATYNGVLETVSANIKAESIQTGDSGGSVAEYVYDFYHPYFYRYFSWGDYTLYMPSATSIYNTYNHNEFIYNHNKITQMSESLQPGTTNYWVYKQNVDLDLIFKFADNQTGECTVYLINAGMFKVDTTISSVQEGIKIYYYGLNPITSLTLGKIGQETLITGGIYASELNLNILGDVTIKGCFYPWLPIVWLDLGNTLTLKLEIPEDENIVYKWTQVNYSKE